MATASYDLTSPVGQVRLLLSDVDPAAYVFTDVEIGTFIDKLARAKNVKRAAALIIDANATNEVLASKVLRSQDVATDGAKAADAMRKHASNLRAEADADEAAETQAADDEGHFSVADFTFDGGYPELTNRPYGGW